MSIKNEEFKSNFGARLKMARKGLGISQGDLSLRTGLARDTISRYERGELTPSAEALCNIIAALGDYSDDGIYIDANWFLFGDPEKIERPILVHSSANLTRIGFENNKGTADISLDGGDVADLLSACSEYLNSNLSNNQYISEALADVVEYFQKDGHNLLLTLRARISYNGVTLTPDSTSNHNLGQQAPLNNVEQNFNEKVSQAAAGDIHNYRK